MKNIRKAEHIPFPGTLIDPHRLTKRTLASFNNARADGRGILLSRNKIHLDVRVTKACLDRACLVMDTLIKALESRGIRVLVEGERPLKTVIEIANEHIEISLNERTYRLVTSLQQKKRKNTKSITG